MAGLTDRALEYILSHWKKRRYFRATLFCLAFLALSSIFLHITQPELFQRALRFGKYLIHKPAAWIASITNDQAFTLQINAPAATKLVGDLALPFTSLHRTANAPHDVFRVLPYAPGVFSLEWKFSAYVLKTWEKKPNSERRLKETTAMSDLLLRQRKFRFAAIVLRKLPTGLYEGTKLIYQEFELADDEWLKTKLVLSPGEVLLGTICSPPYTQDFLGHSFGGALGKMLDAHYLSLDDPSFRSVSLKALAERYGLLSVKGIFGPFAAIVLDPLLENHSILVLQASDSRSVHFLTGNM